ncbi:hypothetical protein AQUCO_01000297v1 [Aquilegia coerulea]|uniref:Misato Segment II tubulin-like domain-containing protein n=1 Tax=Aquilegia coerulea TaxID=218851 RepID=A0A2G5E998_AQUCA|nr:hypothetical protein AQUCO_01000297v1 [Aquilegia coerulea]
MREIVTIQVGDFANFIGSHFWNFQDELLGLAEEPHADQAYKNQSLDTDVLFRAGETQQGTLTYTPRLVSIGLQGSLGSLSSHGSIYNDVPSYDPSHVATWEGNVTKQVAQPHKKNLFLQSLYKEELHQPTPSTNEIKDEDLVKCLENDVQYWTDFSKVHYHPQSLYEVSGLFTGIQGFDNYGIGKDVFSKGPCGEEMNERLRFFVEECDHIQGIQFVVDDSGGFSSVAADFLENIADEYTNTPVMLYSARGPGTYMNPLSQKGSISRALHDAVSFSRLSPLCKLIVPIGLPSLSTSKVSSFLCIKDAKPFHCSAVYAAALHSITTPFRMGLPGPTVDSEYVTGSMDVSGIVSMLTGQGVRSQLNFPESLYSLTPEIAVDVEDLEAIEFMTILGALHSGGKQASILEVKDSIVSTYENAVTRPRFCHLSASLCPLPVPLPFPSIFGNHVGQRGELLQNPIPGSKSRGSLDVHSIPIAARLRSSSAVLPFIEKRLGHLRKFGIERGAAGAQLLRSWGFENDEVGDMGETLSKMVMSLDPYSQVSSDSD